MKDLSFRSIETGLPPLDELVWLANGKGQIWLGCLSDPGEGWLWAQATGDPWIEDGRITAECEFEDLQVGFWAPLPSLDFLNRKS